MTPGKVNRFKELYCVLFGHDFSSNYWQKEGDFVLEHQATCAVCDLSTIDISGKLQMYKENHKV